MYKQILYLMLLFSFNQLSPSIIHFLNNSRQILCISNHENLIIILQPNESYKFSDSSITNLYFYTPNNQTDNQLLILKYQLTILKIDDQEFNISWQDLQIPKKLEILFPEKFLATKYKSSAAQKSSTSNKTANQFQNHTPAQTNSASAQQKISPTSNHKNNQPVYKNDTNIYSQSTEHEDACMAVVSALAQQLKKMHKSIDIDWKMMHETKRNNRKK